MYIFDHIYKTGGTTFNESYLRGAFEPNQFIVLRGMRDDNCADIQNIRRLPEREFYSIQIIAGHNAGQLRTTFPRASILTLVRNPIARAVSGYLHALRHEGAFDVIGRELQEQNIELSQFIEQDLFARRYAPFVSLHNGQAKALFGADNVDCMSPRDSEVVDAIRGRYHLVGYTEAFEMFVFLLHVTEKFPLVLFSKRLVRSERASWQVRDKDLAAIEHYSALDRRVYECVRQEFDRRVADVWSSSIAQRYEEYITALNEFRNEAARSNSLASVRFQPSGGRYCQG